MGASCPIEISLQLAGECPTLIKPDVIHPVWKESVPMTGQRNMITSEDSQSLWNCTLSPGWSREEVRCLRAAIMKFGVGRWREITRSGCLPGKTPSQLSLQCQRMLGQQSLGGRCAQVTLLVPTLTSR